MIADMSSQLEIDIAMNTNHIFKSLSCVYNFLSVLNKHDILNS